MTQPRFTYDCELCGGHMESHKGERFLAFSDRVFDTHTLHHIRAGEIVRPIPEAKIDVECNINERE